MSMGESSYIDPALVINMSVKTFIFLFLIMFLIVTPVTADEEFLNIDIELPDFYEINVSGVSGKPIGISGVIYPGYVTVGLPNKEIDLTNSSLEIRFYYSEIQKMTNFEEATYKEAKPTYPIFGYNNNPSGPPSCEHKRSFEFYDSFNLSDTFGAKLRKGENITLPLFQIEFFETGSYIMEGKWMTEKGEARYRVQRISIIDPPEYAALLQQAQLIEAEKQSAEASEGVAIATRWLALISAGLVGATLVTAFLIPLLGERRKRKSLIRSLYVEIGHNKSAARKMIKIRRDQVVHELTPLDTLSYQNMRMTGEVLNLPENVPRGLDELYELVYVFSYLASTSTSGSC
jgi:hypothetical protein